MLLHLHVNKKKLKRASLAIETGYRILKSVDSDQLASFIRTSYSVSILFSKQDIKL